MNRTISQVGIKGKAMPNLDRVQEGHAGERRKSKRRFSLTVVTQASSRGGVLFTYPEFLDAMAALLSTQEDGGANIQRVCTYTSTYNVPSQV